VWTHRHSELIRTAAQDPVVVRILVNAAIKKTAVQTKTGADAGRFASRMQADRQSAVTVRSLGLCGLSIWVRERLILSSTIVCRPNFASAPSSRAVRVFSSADTHVASRENKRTPTAAANARPRLREASKILGQILRNDACEEANL
jgi:hypothetical protein